MIDENDNPGLVPNKAPQLVVKNDGLQPLNITGRAEIPSIDS